MNRLLPLFPALCLLAITAPSEAQPVSAPHIVAELVADSKAIVPGRTFYLAVRLKPEKGWHTYWRNPGDAGLATTVDLKLPDGFVAGDIQWPYPAPFGDPPDVSYGYDGTVLLPIPVAVADTVTIGQTLSIHAKASWLVCNDICVPGEAVLSVNVRVGKGNEPQGRWLGAIHKALEQVPRPPGMLQVDAARDSAGYTLTIGSRATAKQIPSHVTFLPFDEGVIDHSAKQTMVRRGDVIELRFPRSPYETAPPDRLRGILLAPDGWVVHGQIKAVEIDETLPQ